LKSNFENHQQAKVSQFESNPRKVLILRSPKKQGNMKIAVVGATGLVGSVIIKVLEEGRYLPLPAITGFIPVASPSSAGKWLKFKGQDYQVVDMEEAVSLRPDVAIFSAGSGTSEQWAPAFAEAGIRVIDNSSAWRMNDDVPLVVPEVNAHIITESCMIIANPNCSTIQLALVMAPLHKEFHIRRLVISTYQSVTGSGMKGVKQLENERKGIGAAMIYPHPIDLNLIPQGGAFLANGYSAEEMKLVHETRKILGDQNIQITSTVVRVPVYGGHSMAVNVEFAKEFDLDEVKEIIRNAPGVIIQDEPEKSVYPMPLNARGKDEVFVGRIRRDESCPKALNLWIVADNLRKGAATNAVQIAAFIHKFNQ
jgi:aspartate-semialdehyde dehydrogenase